MNAHDWSINTHACPCHTATTSGGGSKRGGQLAAKSGGQNDNLVVGGMGDCEVESDNTYAEASLLPLQEHHANIMAAAGYNHHGEFLGQKNRFYSIYYFVF